MLLEGFALLEPPLLVLLVLPPSLQKEYDSICFANTQQARLQLKAEA